MGSTHIGTKIDQEAAFRLFDLYAEAGGDFLDTASVYGNWVPGKTNISEKIIGRWMWLRKNRDRVILATKGAHPELATMHVSRLSRAEIVGDLDDSLSNLDTDVIDLYWLHRDDPEHPIGDILETMNDQVQAGKIRYFGCSNWTTARIQATQAYAAERGLQGFVANQPMWSLAAADPDGIEDTTMVVMDQEMERYHRETGLAAVAYSSQGQGLFHRMAAGTF
jgi:aryl-alcohol dehydrogenase-like predicted oxidoreductase